MKDLLAIRTGLPSRIYFFLALFAFLFPVVVWAIYSYGGYVQPYLLPSPSAVLEALVRTGSEGVLSKDIALSVFRVTAGFLLSAALAVPLGILMGTFVSVEALQEPFVDFVRYMPAAAFIPLIMLYVGIGEWAKILVIFIGTYFQLILMIMEVSRGVPLELLNVSYTLGATKRQVLTRVVLPGAMPGIFESLRMSLGWAWTYLVVAELVAAESGLGFRIMQSQRFLKTDVIFCYIILIGILGLLSDYGFKKFNEWAFRWNRKTREA